MSDLSNSSAVTGIPWTPPTSIANLNFTNCTLLSHYVTQLVAVGDPGIWTTVFLLQDTLNSSSNHTDIHMGSPTSDKLLGWYYNWSDTEHWDFAVVIRRCLDTSASCRDEMCRTIGSQGNADLSGRGMLTTYIAQAVLVTLYFAVFMFLRLSTTAAGTYANQCSTTSRWLFAVRDSTPVILEASLFFSISMLIAAIYIIGRDLDAPETTLTAYAFLTTVFVSLFSTLPALLLQLCADNDLRRRKWRVCLWTFVGLLVIAVVTLFFLHPYPLHEYVNNINLKDTEMQNNWEAMCLDVAVATSFKKVVKALATGIVPIYLAYLALEFSLRRENVPNKILARYWWVVAILCLWAIWACLGAFLYYRKKLQKNAGELNKDREWSFGQVLALATFAPVVVEALHIRFSGPKEALTGQMMKPWTVTMDDENAHNYGAVDWTQRYSRIKAPGWQSTYSQS